MNDHKYEAVESLLKYSKYIYVPTTNL